MWLIWLERNRRNFEDTKLSFIVMKGRLLAVFQYWDSGVASPDACLFIDFLDTLAV